MRVCQFGSESTDSTLASCKRMKRVVKMVPYIQLVINFTSRLQKCPHVAIKFAMNVIFIITFMVPTKKLVSDY